MKKIVIISIILIQLIIIGLMGQRLYTSSHVLGKVSTNLIQSNWIITQKTDELDYFYELKPNSIIIPEPIFSGLEHVRYNINEDGLNQIENYSEKKGDDTYRIVAIGDSYTFGQNVNTNETYPSQLQHLLNTTVSCQGIKKFEVINLGVYGYDIRYTIERFKKRGIKYNPDLVVWLVIADDFKRINEKLYPKMREYTKQAKETGEYDKQIKSGNYYLYWNKAREEVIDEFGGEEKLLPLQKKYLYDITNYYSGTMLLASDPSLPKEYKQLLTEFSRSRKYTYIHDRLPHIEAIADAILPDFHPNKNGYNLISKSIMDYLVHSQLLSCSVK